MVKIVVILYYSSSVDLNRNPAVKAGKRSWREMNKTMDSILLDLKYIKQDGKQILVNTDYLEKKHITPTS